MSKPSPASPARNVTVCPPGPRDEALGMSRIPVRDSFLAGSGLFEGWRDGMFLATAMETEPPPGSGKRRRGQEVPELDFGDLD